MKRMIKMIMVMVRQVIVAGDGIDDYGALRAILMASMLILMIMLMMVATMSLMMLVTVMILMAMVVKAIHR